MIREEIDDRRPWDRDKRSWIFYTEYIKNEKAMIYGEVGDNVYCFSLETAQLSIWSGEWKAFIDFGISRLLLQMNYQNNSEGNQHMKMRILYKGIEFRSDYEASDAEFLEFIDIKGDLERNYVNIDRKGFTEDGERYFKETLYPGLMRSVHEVLNHLGSQKKTDSLKEDELFTARVLKTIDGKCKEIRNEQEREKKNNEEMCLLSFVVSVCILAYFSKRDEWSIMEKMGTEKYRDTGWSNLIKEINTILVASENSELLTDFSRLSYFFDLHIYAGQDYLKKPETNDIRKRPNIVDIFMEGKHWGILSCRREQSDDWVSMLVALDETSEDRRCYEWLTEINRAGHQEESIEEWGTRKCTISYSAVVDRLLESAHVRSQILAIWLLKNVPSIAAFCNDDGSVIFNVLSSRVYPSIFLNKNYKYEILQRIMEEAAKKDFQRFSTIIWQKRETVGCRNLPFSIFFVKFGFLPEYTYYKGIVPQEGKVLKYWGAYLKSGVFERRKKQLSELASHMNIVECLNNTVFHDLSENNRKFRMIYQKNTLNVAMDMASVLADLIVSSIQPKKITTIELLPDWVIDIADYYEYWMDIYRDVVYIYYSSMHGFVLNDRMTNAESFLTKWKKHEAFDALCNAWTCCTVYRSELLDNKWAMEQYIRLKNADAEKKMARILNYLREHQMFSLAEEELALSLEEYENEFIELAQGIATRILTHAIEDNLRGCTVIEKKIKDRFRHTKE